VFERSLQKLGANIRRAREQQGFTQEAFAQELQMDRAYYGRIERGLVNISAKTIFMLAAALDEEPKDLLTDVEHRSDGEAPEDG
jgi:transcriptional regulator with XRE-family HTH domain